MGEPDLADKLPESKDADLDRLANDAVSNYRIWTSTAPGNERTKNGATSCFTDLAQTCKKDVSFKRRTSMQSFPAVTAMKP